MASRERCRGMGPCAAYPDPVMPHQPRGAMSDDPAKPPRFPYIAALLCTACLGAAVWTWMRYSYAWEVTPDQAVQSGSMIKAGRWPADAYVILDCRDQDVSDARVRLSDPAWKMLLSGFGTEPGVEDCRGRLSAVYVSELDAEIPGKAHEHKLLFLHAASRYHGASIAGLVVGAMGVFVFTVVLLHWLGERRAWREKTEGITPG